MFNYSKIWVVCFLIISPLIAREMRTPLALQYGPLHKVCYNYSNSTCAGSVWASAYHRKANCAFGPCNNATITLAQLLFGAANFRGAQAFVPGTSSLFAPFLTRALLSPRFVYRERGGVIGADLEHCVNEKWDVGVRAVLPIRSVRVTRTKNGVTTGSSDLGGQALDDVIINQPDGFAYRLDFLSQLPYACEGLGLQYPIVNYHDLDFPPENPITISNQDITDQNNNPVTTIKRIDGSTPSGTFAVPQAVATSLPALSADGNSGAQDERQRFVVATDYTPLGSNISNQSTLWIVPTFDPVTGRLVAPARIIRAHVNELLDCCILPSAEALFAQCGITFNSQCIKGFGDLDTELFVRYHITDCLDAEGIFGVRFPTGKKIKNPGAVLAQPLGNNGHTELMLGAKIAWDLSDILLANLDASYSFVLPHNEQVAAAFLGATIKNIGPATSARISWNYVFCRATLTIFNPWCCTSGIIVGYEFYGKSCDKINFFCCNHKGILADCLGRQQLLDGKLLAQNTKRSAHKIRGELFWDHNCISLFAGGAYTIAGKNIQKDIDWYGGIRVSF